MAKIGLTTRLHTHPYYIQWLNNTGKAKATHTTHVHFSIDTYHDYADCDVVPMMFSFIGSSLGVLLRLICQEQFHRHSVCKTPTFIS
jgi:hypothetical protein